jgi:hypothetical protein
MYVISGATGHTGNVVIDNPTVDLLEVRFWIASALPTTRTPTIENK